MKKRLVLLTVALVSSMSYAQQDMGDDQVPKNKKGNEILPKAGDIGLGFNTIPLLDVIFETFKPTSSGTGSLVQYAQSNNQIVGKYFLDAKTAIRARIGINTLSGSITNRVQDSKALYDASFGTADDVAAARLMQVSDRLEFNKSNIMISAGLEKRRGYRRLQGYYGGEIGFGRTGSRENITYGNAYSDQFAVEYTNNFNSLSTTSVSPTGSGRHERILETRHRGGFRFGLRGFIGIEYFIFAKISVGAEYGWGWSVATRRSELITREVYFNGQNGPSAIKEEVNADSREVLRGFSVDNNDGSLFSMDNTLNGNTILHGGAGALTLMFHF